MSPTTARDSAALPIGAQVVLRPLANPLTLGFLALAVATLLLSGVQPQPMKVMFESDFVAQLGEHKFCADLDDALNTARKLLAT